MSRRRSTNGTNGHNGHNGTPVTAMSLAERLDIMRATGWEQILPPTGRKILLRSLEADKLLRDGECPDILTPLLIRSIYDELNDTAIREFLDTPAVILEDALKYVDMLNLIAGKAIADGTKVTDLTLAEKKWIFRLVLTGAETLVYFRFEPTPDVALVAEVNDVPQAAE